MTLAALAADGPGDNIHLRLTDVEARVDSTIIETTAVVGQEAGWRTVWIPAVPRLADQEQAGGKAVKVLLTSHSIDNETELAEFAAKTEFPGMVINDIDKLGIEETKLL